MEESVRPSYTVSQPPPHIDLQAIPRPAQRDGKPVEAAATPSPKALPAAWEARYRAWVIGSDVFITLLVIAISAFVIDRVAPHDMHAFGTILAVFVSLPVSRAWSPRVLGEGAEEYRTLGRGFITAAVLVALGGLLFGALEVQVWVFVVVPAIALVAFPQRYLLRQVLHRKRAKGLCLLPVMAAGSPETVADLIARTKSEAHVGWRVEAACTFTGPRRRARQRRDRRRPGGREAGGAVPARAPRRLPRRRDHRPTSTGRRSGCSGWPGTWRAPARRWSSRPC